MLSIILAQVPQVRYGFFAIRGFFGLLIGLLLMFVVLWGIWSVFDIIAKKFSTEQTGWMFQIVRVILIVITVIYFVNVMFSLFPF